MNQVAITRDVSPNIHRCELTHLERAPISYERAAEQHEEYRTALTELGCKVLRLPPEPGLPDSVFVEDTAIVLDRVAVLTRPGADSRKAEVALMAHALEPFRELLRMPGPGTLDGGDVLRLGRRLFVGLSSRSTSGGIDALTELVEPHGYSVQGVAITNCLHLKSAVTAIGDDRVLLNPDWVDPRAFDEADRVEVDPGEPAAANALMIGDSVIHSSAHPRTAERLRRAGIRVRAVDASELAKAEGGVTCCSVILEIP